MNALELKGGLYDMIARVNDKELLAKMHGMISQLIDQSLAQTDFWDELPEEKQRELDLAYEESLVEENLVDGETALNQIQSWRKKG